MTTENVQNIATAMAAIEKRASHSIKDARSLRADFLAISSGSDVPVLLASKYHAELVALATAHAADVLDLHYRMTEDAKAYGIDVPALPGSEDDGEVVILGGGDR